MRRRIKMNDSKKTCCEKETAEENDSFLKCLKEGEKSADEKINSLLKALKNDNREVCFSLLNCLCLNKDIEFQNLKESFAENVEGGADANEYINVNLLEKEIYPQDGGYEEEKKRREKMYNMILHIKRSLKGADEKYRKIDTYIELASRKEEKKLNLKKEQHEKHNIDDNEFNNNIPHYWKKSDVVRTFNPVYNARIKLMNDEVMNAIPTVDIFYNSSKLLSIQTIFEPVSRYIFLLRLLPHFCLPLYDSGILQFVCEDAYLNPKFKGLEISYRLLIHDILFYAFFSYLADLPFWAKPPIQLLRIYNYESLYSFNDWDSVHTERLVFHNIKNILFNFSDTLSKIELLYPKDYYITVFPNIYFKNVIDFLRSEHFKLKKIVIVVKGKKYIDENMMKVFRENLQEFKGMTTENVKKAKGLNNVSFKTGTPHIKGRTTKNVIEAMKNCVMLDKKDTQQNAKDDILITDSASNKTKGLNNMKNKNSPKRYVESASESECSSTDDDKINKKYNSISKWKKEQENMAHKREKTFMKDKRSNETYAYKTKDALEESKTNQKGFTEGTTCNRANKKSIGNNVNTNYKTWKEKVNSLDRVDLSNKYNMDNALYNMYYNRTQEKKEDDDEEENLFFNTTQSENTKEVEKIQNINETREECNKQTNASSSGSTCSEDESDDENVDGFFKSKKLKTTVYDKKSFSLTQIMSNVIHFERIIEYLYSDDHHVYDPHARVKFYVKLLAFEKTYTHVDDQLNSSNVSENGRAATVENAVGIATREGEEAEAEVGSNIRDRAAVSVENNDFLENNMSEENGNIENTETTTDANGGSRRNIIFNNFIPNEASTSISNLIRNFQISLEQNNFLPFTGVGIEEETPENSETHQNSFSFDNIQDSLTRITFNFN